jgi:hypothetical protein
MDLRMAPLVRVLQPRVFSPFLSCNPGPGREAGSLNVLADLSLVHSSSQTLALRHSLAAWMLEVQTQGDGGVMHPV